MEPAAAATHTAVIEPTVPVEPTMAPTVAIEAAAPAPGGSDTIPAPVPSAPEGPPLAELCKKAVTALGRGDVSLLKTLPASTQTALDSEGLVMQALFCIAVATNDTTFCKSLASPRDGECLGQLGLIHGIKNLPEGASALPLVTPEYYKQCLPRFPKAECDKFEQAWTTGKAETCKGLTKDLGAFCSAVLNGAAAQCPPSEGDCSKLIADLAKLQKDGLAALDDPMALAALKGKEQCAPYLATVEQRCLH